MAIINAMITKTRIILFIGVVILISFSMLFSNEKQLFEALNVNNLTIYTNSNIADFETSLSGNGFTFSCNINEYKKLKCDVDGISFETQLSPKQIFDKVNLKIQNKQTITQAENTIEIYYCYLENLKPEIAIENKRVNL